MVKVLLVDDDAQALASTRKILELSGFEVATANDGREALELMRAGDADFSKINFDAIITDVRMPRLSGLEFLKTLSACGDNTPVILMTAFGSIEDAVWAMKLGAVDFLAKPFKRKALLDAVNAALKRKGQCRNVSDGEKNKSTAAFINLQKGTIIGSSRALIDLKKQIQHVAPTKASVLLTGESGTGKELVAKNIHNCSSRAGKNFVALNCAALPENLIEAELFGFEKGAFTGAVNAKEGLFEAANGGTILLDEIGDMPIATQSKLLRVLEDGEVRPIGSTKTMKFDVRVIAATNKNLRESVKMGSFREDLLFRLEVVQLCVPPLRDRIEDIPELISYFFELFSAKHNKFVNAINKEAMDVLLNHSWPGNIRELSNVIERAVIFAQTSEICPQELPVHFMGQKNNFINSGPDGSISVPIGTSLENVKDMLIRKTLEVTDGDKNMTAKLLGINSRTIYRKLTKDSQS